MADDDGRPWFCLLLYTTVAYFCHCDKIQILHYKHLYLATSELYTHGNSQ